jgi:hypothetical protein
MRTVIRYLWMLLLTACGPSVADGVFPIKNGYVYSDSGGNGKAINFQERKDWYVGVIDARVDAYVLDGIRIIVARRPAQTVMLNGIANDKLSRTCEYWMINTETRAVTQISDASNWPSVRCDMYKNYGAIVENGQ